MTAELKSNAATGALASVCKPYSAQRHSGVWWHKPQGSKARINKPQINADERRLIASEREERKAEQHKSLYPYKIIRPGTRMTRIKRISTDNSIRAYPCHPRNPCSIVYNSDGKISNLWHFSSIREQEAAQ